jgi:D-alanyl-D-alanine carboxypeptidase/D-alanyl-D-alanine-endopeptidase (penicillin-binding protein 4)
MQKLFVFFFLILGHSFSFLQATTEPVKPNNPVQNYAETMMQKDALQSAAFSFYVKDMSTGILVADYNGQMSIPSASTMKLVTTATATQYLGRGYRYKTKLMYSGVIDTITGVLNGDIYIIGGGDPTLGSKYYTKEGHERDFLYEWADSIKNFGILGINGRVIADASKYSYNGVPSGWVWGDLGNYYGAGPSGLTIFDNMCRLEFKTGKNAGDSTNIICTQPFVPGLTISNSVTSADSKKDNAYVYGAPYSLDWFVQGSIPKGRESFVVKASIPDPEYITAIEFNQALAESGIPTRFAPTTYRELNKENPFIKPELKTIHTHSSPTVASIMNLVNRNSVNLFAEHILCEISYKKSGYGSTHNGALFCMNYWRSKVGSGLFMTDGSGLSRSNAVSANFLTKLLTYMHKSKSASKFRESLALAGKRGTMSGMCRGTAAAGRVYGKSGTMTRCKSYAGYVDTKTGKKLAYAMIINNYTCSNSQVRKYFEFLMVKMANY